MSLEPLAENKFARQYKADRKFDSICTRCFLVVGRANTAIDLVDLESRHICQPAERRKTIRIAGQPVDSMHEHKDKK